MNSLSFRRTLAVALLVLSSTSITVPASAAKRRAVAHAPRGAEVTGTVKGKVTDAVTGQPVVRVRVVAGGSDYTDASGNYEIKTARGYGAIVVEGTRSGYATWTSTRLAAGDHVVNFTMQPRPTVSVKRTSGADLKLDFDTLEFGYGVPFSGYRKSVSEEFCVNGTILTVHKTEMKRMTGPASYVAAGSCCAEKSQLMKMNIELKSKPAADYIFSDSCYINVPIDLIGVDHLTGEDVYLHLTEVSEVVFP